jgi:hypothetical protein
MNNPIALLPANDTEALDTNELEVVKKYSPLFPGLHWNRNAIENGFSKEQYPDINTCPLCRATTERRYTRLFCKTLSGIGLYLGPVGWFCSGCPTVIIDDTAVRSEFSKEDGDIEIFAVQARDNDHPHPLKTWNKAWLFFFPNEDNSKSQFISFPFPKGPREGPEEKPEDMLSIQLPGGQFFRLKSGLLAGRSFAFLVRSCQNPTCPCRTEQWLCLPLTDDLKTPLEGGTILFVNVAHDSKTVTVYSEGHESEHERALVKALNQDLTAQDWHLLFDYFVSGKFEDLKCLDEKNTRVEFPLEFLPNDRPMVPMANAFPNYPGFQFTHKNDGWVLQDSYCVTPSCPCKEVALEFFSIPREPHLHAGKEIRNSSFGANYSYLDRRLTQVFPYEDGLGDEKTLRAKVGDLLNDVRGKFPEFEARLELHRKILRTQFANWLKRQRKSGRHARTTSLASEDRETGIPAPRAVASETGRNDPCPCGSGKKHKKCCGA